MARLDGKTLSCEGINQKTAFRGFLLSVSLIVLVVLFLEFLEVLEVFGPDPIAQIIFVLGAELAAALATHTDVYTFPGLSLVVDFLLILRFKVVVERGVLVGGRKQ